MLKRRISIQIIQSPYDQLHVLWTHFKFKYKHSAGLSHFEQWSISGSSEQRTWTSGFAMVCHGFTKKSFRNFKPGHYLSNLEVPVVWWIPVHSMPEPPSDCSSNSSRGGYTSSASKSCQWQPRYSSFWTAKRDNYIEENPREKMRIENWMGISMNFANATSGSWKK